LCTAAARTSLAVERTSLAIAAIVAVFASCALAVGTGAMTSAPAWGSAVAAPAAATLVRVDIVMVSGLIDPLNDDLLMRSVRHAVADHAMVLVVQLNSTGGALSPKALKDLTSEVRSAPVPVAAWVGGSGRPRAYGAAYEVLRSADFTGSGPSARVGASGAAGEAADLSKRTISGDDAVDAHLLAISAPTLVDFIGDLDGRTIKGTTIRVGAAGQVAGAQVPSGGVPVPGGPGRGFRKDIEFTFSQLSVLPKLMHTAASPNVAFVMLLIALSLMVFEFFTAGVGVAAATGAVFAALAAYGLGVLPARPYAIALVAMSVAAFAIDVQAGAPRVWTVVGAVAYVVGSVRLYDGQTVSLWVIVGAGLLLALLMVSGMPAMVRTRFSTPTIGREKMVGAMGVALSRVEPEGTVTVNGAPWRARTNRATPIPAGEAIRVVAIDGLLLEVEPETGGAREAHH